MSLKDEIAGDLKSALKSGDSFTASVFRMLNATLQNKEIEKRGKGEEAELTDEEVKRLLMSEAKKRKESISAFEKGGRSELAEKEKKELAVIGKYLPEQLGEDEIRAVVEKVLSEIETANIGEAMKAVMVHLKDKADGALISQVVKEKLG